MGGLTELGPLVAEPAEQTLARARAQLGDQIIMSGQVAAFQPVAPRKINHTEIGLVVAVLATVVVMLGGVVVSIQVNRSADAAFAACHVATKQGAPSNGQGKERRQ